MTEAPDYVEPVMGVRRWTVVGGKLRSTGVESPPWQPGCCERAICTRHLYPDSDAAGKAAHEFQVPVEGCTCGYHAWVGLKTCTRLFPVQPPKATVFADEHGAVGRVPSSWRAINEMVAGVVSSWGKIILCEYGFRAEYMKIEALILPENASVEVFGHSVSIEEAYKALAKKYKVPFIWEAEVDTFVRERGVVLEPDPAPGEEINQGYAYVGRNMGPAFLSSGQSAGFQKIANTTQGVQVFYDKPSWWKRQEELLMGCVSVVGLATSVTAMTWAYTSSGFDSLLWMLAASLSWLVFSLGVEAIVAGRITG